MPIDRKIKLFIGDIESVPMTAMAQNEIEYFDGVKNNFPRCPICNDSGYVIEPKNKRTRGGKMIPLGYHIVDCCACYWYSFLHDDQAEQIELAWREDAAMSALRGL